MHLNITKPGEISQVERAENGYRIYTEEHKAYLQCIRALNTGFGMNLVKKVMPLIIKDETIKALWIINEAQVDLQKENLLLKEQSISFH